MNKLNTIIILSALFTLYSCTEEVKNMTDKSSTIEFAKLGDEEGFAEKHNEPENIEFNPLGSMMKLPIEGEEESNVYHIVNKESNKYLFVIHEWWGLNDNIKKEADKWFEKLGNVNIMALDLYDGKVATTREKAQEFMQGADEGRIEKIIDAALKQLPDNAEIGTIGWCFGGGWSLKAALRAGNKAYACVMYYGMPIKDVDRLKSLNTNVLFIYGTQDKWINEAVVNEFKKNMEMAGKATQVLAFDADHAFANPSSEHYIERAAQEANESVYGYFRARLN